MLPIYFNGLHYISIIARVMMPLIQNMGKNYGECPKFVCQLHFVTNCYTREKHSYSDCYNVLLNDHAGPCINEKFNFRGGN